MNLITVHKFVVAALLVGLGFGWWITYDVMQGRIDKIQLAHTEELRQREVQRGKDERAARQVEQELAARAGQIEQEKQNAIATANADAAALIARLRNQVASKPTGTGAVPRPATDCQVAAGTVVPERTGNDLVRLAQRADELRSALGACYAAYDSLGKRF